MSYENATSTRLLATHCVACGRPLRDADSVEIGMGPICRKKYMPAYDGLDPEVKKKANTLVHEAGVLATDRTRENVKRIIQIGEEIKALGVPTLAAKLADNFVPIRIKRANQPNDLADRYSGRWDAGEPVFKFRMPYERNAIATMRRVFPTNKVFRWDRDEKAWYVRQRSAQGEFMGWYLMRVFAELFPGAIAVGDDGPFDIPTGPEIDAMSRDAA